MKRIISIFLIIITLLCGCAVPEAETIPPSVFETLYQIKAECFFEEHIQQDINYTSSLSEKQIHYELFKILNYKSELAFLIENGVDSSQYQASRALIDMEYKRIVGIEGQYRADLARLEAEAKEAEEAAKWAERMEEYPTATTIWLYMKNELGWNDYVCAGVMGNMMWETGGGTLKLNWKLWDAQWNAFYGICQWYRRYYPEVMNTSLEFQLKFLKNNVQKEINTFGYKYQKGFRYTDFIELQNEQAAAEAFARAYERCKEWAIAPRLPAATRAYDYFTS